MNALLLPIIILIVVGMVLSIYIHVPWWLKITSWLVITFVIFLISISFDSYLGYPGSDAMPKKALLFWTVVSEPDESINSKGWIEFWLIPKEMEKAKETLLKKIVSSITDSMKKKPSLYEMRVYKVPYTRGLHEQVVKYQKHIIFKKGKPIYIGFEKSNDPLALREGENDAEMRSGDRNSHYMMSELQPEATPPKIVE